MADRPAALLFDWDNTLVDAWAGVAAALNASLAAFGMPTWTVPEVRARVRGSLRDTFPAMFGDDWTRARDVFYATLAAGHLDHVTPMPGADAALRAGAPWPMAVVSNKSGQYLRREVTHLGWDRWFGAVVGAGDAAADKPDAAPLLMALERIGVAADSSVWFVGDTAIDMQAARAAGARAVLVGDAAHDGGVALAGADIVFADAHGLAERLAELA